MRVLVAEDEPKQAGWEALGEVMRGALGTLHNRPVVYSARRRPSRAIESAPAYPAAAAAAASSASAWS